jgi:predicted HAD superfamily Cof-like phosphohydrolase
MTGPAGGHLGHGPGTGAWSADRMLLEFYRKFGAHLPAAATADIPPALETLRQELLDSEVQELRDAVAAGDIIAIADAVGDIGYVLAGTAVTYGFSFDAVLAAVHESNMTKTGLPGRSWAAGERKLVKGPGFRPPRIREALSLGLPGSGDSAASGRDTARRDAAHENDEVRLDEIAALITPCPPPDVLAGFDLCPCGRGGTWPCGLTRAAWLARRLDPAAESKRILGEIVRNAGPGAEDGPW